MSMKTYYQMSEEEVRREVNQGSQPLTAEQVRDRQKEYGPNELTEGEKKSLLGIFAEQFRDFLVIILMISAAVSWILGEGESALVILVVITMNAVLGTVQTVKAEQSLSSLKRLCSPSAKVLRDGVVVEIPSREVTVGDEVYLEAGDYIAGRWKNSRECQYEDR